MYERALHWTSLGVGIRVNCVYTVYCIGHCSNNYWILKSDFNKKEFENCVLLLSSILFLPVWPFCSSCSWSHCCIGSKNFPQSFSLASLRVNVNLGRLKLFLNLSISDISDMVLNSWLRKPHRKCCADVDFFFQVGYGRPLWHKRLSIRFFKPVNGSRK